MTDMITTYNEQQWILINIEAVVIPAPIMMIVITKPIVIKLKNLYNYEYK